MRLLSCVAGLAATLSMTVAVASPIAKATVAQQAQETLDHAVAAQGPGAAVLIAQGDTVVFRGARGQAEIELGVPLSADQVFRIASVTKMFVAATVIKLSELGKLSLDDPLSKYLPDFPNADRITLRQLLNHTAGISDVAKDPQPGFARRDIDTATLIAEIRKRSPEFAPGTQWAYSNAGYILLGAVIEKVTGQPWHAALRTWVLEPVGIEGIRYGDNAPLIRGRVAGYTTDNPDHRVENARFISPSIPAAAGGLVGAVDDLMRWMRALAGGRIISRKDFASMAEAVPTMPGVSPMHRYGMGMYQWQVRGHEMLGHTGQINGFASAVAYLPERDITVVVLANDDNFDARTMSRRLAAIALGEPYAEPVAVTTASDTALHALEGTYRIDAQTLQTLSVKDHRLFAQRGHGKVVPLQLATDQKLYFVPDELSYFAPVRDASGRVTRLDYFEGGDGPAAAWPKVPAAASTP